jgi:hypothetical protein
MGRVGDVLSYYRPIRLVCHNETQERFAGRDQGIWYLGGLSSRPFWRQDGVGGKRGGFCLRRGYRSGKRSQRAGQWKNDG